jgi:hypothetical protein
VTRVPGPNASHRNPWFLPDGRHFLFTMRERTADALAAIAVASLDGADARALVERGSNPQYAAGYLFFVVDRNLVAQGFDAEKQALLPQRLPIDDAVEAYDPRDLAQFSVSPAGILGFRKIRMRRSQLVWLDREGKHLGNVGEPSYYVMGPFQGVHLGPDGRTLLATRVDEAGANADVWTLDLRSSQLTRSTFVSSAADNCAVPSPDGARIAVSASPVGGFGGAKLWIQAASGSGSQQLLLEKTSFHVEAWSPDGAVLLGAVQEPETGFDVAYLAIADPSKVVRLVSSRLDELAPALSPNGRWIAYQSNETGRHEVFLSDFPAAVRKWQVSRSGGVGPSWRRDGLELYFQDPEGIMAARLDERGGSLEVQTPVRLPFPREIMRLARGVPSQDGKRFLAVRVEPDTFTEPIRLIRGWRQLIDERAAR